MKPYQLSKEESDRITIIKYLSIIFVVYIHSYATTVSFTDGVDSLNLPQWLFYVEEFVSQVISRCAVPIFFLLSSVLLFKTKRSYGKTIKSKAKTVLVPYLIWNTFWIVAFIVLQSLSFTAPYFKGERTPILQSSAWEWLGLYGINDRPMDYPLWFVRDLMAVTLIFPLVRFVASKFPKTLLLASVTVFLIPVSFPFKEALVWFCIGACIVRLQIRLTALDRLSLWKCSIVYLICSLITLTIRHGIAGDLFILIGILYWVRVSKSIYDSEKARKLFLWLAKWTFCIYVLHEMTLTGLKKICFRLLPTSPAWILAEYFIVPLIVIVGCCVAGALLKKISPKLYGIATGSR